jgi:hypothetical protein
MGFGSLLVSLDRAGMGLLCFLATGLYTVLFL